MTRLRPRLRRGRRSTNSETRNNPSESSTSKSQNAHYEIWSLEAWIFFGAWCLGFGTFMLLGMARSMTVPSPNELTLGIGDLTHLYEPAFLQHASGTVNLGQGVSAYFSHAVRAGEVKQPAGCFRGKPRP